MRKLYITIGGESRPGVTHWGGGKLRIGTRGRPVDMKKPGNTQAVMQKPCKQ